MLPAPPAKADEAAAARLEVLQRRGAETCLSAGALAANVERRLGRAVFERRPAELSVRVVFEQRSGAWQARVELDDARGPLGVRELSTSAAHCSALDDSVSLVVALLVDTPPEREPAPEAPLPAPAPAPAPTPIRVPEETFAPRAALELEPVIRGLVGYGQLPELDVGAEVGLFLAAPRWPRVFVRLQVFRPREVELGARSAGAELGSERVGLELCPFGTRAGSVELWGCAGQRVGRLWAAGFGFDRNLRSNRFSYALSAGVEAAAALAGPLRASAGVRAEIPLTRDDFGVRPRGGDAVVLFRPEPFALELAIGLGGRF